MRISVIVPIYNAESTLLRCVKSIEDSLDKLYQRYLVDGEVVLVNDGSTDGSLSMCKALSRKYKNVLFITQKNGGAAAAKNMGISISSGEYIAFVNAKDAVNGRYFISLYAEMKADTALVISKPDKYLNNNQKINSITAKADKLRVIETPWDAMEDFFVKNEIFTVLGSLFRRVYLQKNFNEKLSAFDDMCFLSDYLTVAKGVIKVIPEKEYIYYFNEDSKIDLEKFEMIREAYMYVKDRMVDAGCPSAGQMDLKYINCFAKNYLKLAHEEQNSDKGRELLETFKIDVKNIGKNLHMSLADSILCIGMMTNPELVGDFVKHSMQSMYKLNRT